MGQTCCRPWRENGDVSGDESWKQTGATPAIGTLSDLPPTRVYLSDSDDDFLDARSIGSMSVYSTTSNLSYLSMDDVVDQYQEDLYGDIHDLDEELEAAAATGGHFVPKEIEDAATEGMEMAEEVSAGGWFSIFTNSSKTQDIVTSTTTTDSIPVVHVSSLGTDVGTPLPAFPQAATPLPDYFSTEAVLTELQHVKKLIKYARILEAHELILKICEDCNNINENNTLKLSLPSLIPHSAALDIDIAALETDVLALNSALASLEDDSGWMVSRKGELRVLYAHKKGTTQHSLKFHAVFPHPVEHILALAHEWDLLPTWNKFSLEAIKLAEPSIFESIVYGAQWMMKPFRQMQAIVRANGYDLAASPLHRCLLITMNDVSDTDIQALGIENRYPHLPAAMAKRNTVNLLKKSCIKLRPLPPLEQQNKSSIPRTDAHFMVHLDPHISYVPSSLVNFVLGILAPYIYNQMLKVLDKAFQEPDGEYPKRVRDQPELYGLVAERMAEFADQLTSVAK